MIKPSLKVALYPLMRRKQAPAQSVSVHEQYLSLSKLFQEQGSILLPSVAFYLLQLLIHTVLFYQLIIGKLA